ncbi:S8 family serine peptidase [Nocardioides marinquilinus]|uniref:S8 family serine peptidase n=1 Tax=Nocardioides marinquilinus TaxID=1210400 RepID=A0ABP9PEG7_9ACTN
MPAVLTSSARRSRIAAAFALSLTLGATGLGGLATTASAAPDPAAPGGLNAGPADLSQPEAAQDDAAGDDLGLPPSLRQGKRPQSYLLELDGRSTSAAFAAARRGGSKASAARAASTRLAQIRSAQRDVVRALPRSASVLYRTHATVPGVAVRATVGDASRLAGIAGVSAVRPIALKQQTNGYAVPLQGAPQVWEGRGDLGQDTTIAIIDSGIDYTHANFGGPGTRQAYEQAFGALGASPSFPSEKVIGGYDLAGDDYDADPNNDTYNPVPSPDDFPLDCDANGHGSHVAGSAAGLGENADGSTYTGSYDTDTPFDQMKIGPGMAPAAKLYAYRVFGCFGSTDLVGAAIEMAVDPNGDGDPSDHVDVINMSLGSTFGSPEDADATVSEAAVAAGVVVTASSGNSGDVRDVGGAPGNAPTLLTVANTQDASEVVDATYFSVAGGAPQRAASSRAVLYDWDTQPDLQGQVVELTGANAAACDPLNSTDQAKVDGKVALVTWTQDALECGSIARGGNLAAAGAIGFVFHNSADNFSGGINGSAVIPGVLMAKSPADAISAAINAGQTVVINGTQPTAFQQVLGENNDKVNTDSSRNLHATDGLKPDVAAVGTTVFSTEAGGGTDGVSFSGTSMSAPMVAGLSSLVVSEHPAWTPEQVKAAIMNTAGQDVYTGDFHTGDVYGPNRVGAGRIQAQPALETEVVAYNADAPGTVSVSFGPVEVSGPTSLHRTVTVQNTGLSTITYNLSYDPITEVPGVDVLLDTDSVTVGPRSSATFQVSLLAPDPSALTKTVDPTMPPVGVQGYPVETLAETSGRVLLTPSTQAQPQLRVPVYAAPRPASTMTQPDSVPMAPGVDEATLAMSGGDVGVGQTNGANDGDFTDAVRSIAAGFELTAVSGQSPFCSQTVTFACLRLPEERAADIEYVGVTSDYPLYQNVDDSLAYFAVAAHAPVSTPASKIYYQIDLDVDGDKAPDLFLYNTRLGDDDTFVSQLLDPAVGVVDLQLLDARFGDTDMAAYDSDVQMLPVSLAALASYGIDVDNPRIGYGVETYSAYSSQPIDLVGVDPATGDLQLSTDVYSPAIVVDNGGEAPLMLDRDGDTLNVTRNAASYAADGGLGVLMLHFHNHVGDKAQVVDLSAPSELALSASPTSLVRGATTKLTVTASGEGDAPTGRVVIRRGGSVVAQGNLSAGRFTATVKVPTVGRTTFTASYEGAGGYQPSTATTAVTARKAPAAVSVALSKASGKVGKPVKATVTVKTVNGIKPTGKVTLTVGGKKQQAAVRNGKAVFTVTPRKAGKLTMVATYPGDATYLSGKSKPVTYTVTK